jgi:nucleoid-associated protein YgaU
MTQATSRPTRASTLRAIVIVLLALAAVDLLWRWRPTASIPTTSADSGIVAGCAWLGWALAGYLAIAVTVTAATHVATRGSAAAGGAAATSMRRIAPMHLRRLVDAAITVSVAGALIGSTAAAPAVALSVSNATGRAPTVAGSPFDWPGLSASQTSGSGHAPRPHQNQPARHPPHANPTDGGATDSGAVVVEAGDTLWAIAARHLAPHSSAATVTAAWHSWYAANRSTIGSDPNVIQPGQRLVVPNAATID